MAAVLMLGDTQVATWAGAGAPPWPIEFTPLGTYTLAGAVLTTWPMYSKATDQSGQLRGWRGSPRVVTGMSITVPFFIYRKVYWLADGDEWGLYGNTEAIASSVATLGEGAPVALTWANCSRIVFAATSLASLRAEGASVSGALAAGGAYLSGDPIVDSNARIVLTASPSSDGEGHDASTSPSRMFWKWVCTETEEEYTTEQITVPPPPGTETHTYTAFWKPNSVLVEVAAGDNGIEVAHFDTSGFYYSKSGTGEPDMPMFYARVVVGQETDRAFLKWTKTVYSIDPVTGEELPGFPEDVAATTDAEYPAYEAVQTVRETGDTVARVVYSAHSKYTHDRVAASVANTYLLKGAGYTLTPAVSTRFGDDGYAGAYSLSYNQPADVGYTVDCRRAGDLTAGTFTGTDSGAFTDGETGRLWAASYILFAVDAEGEPVGPEEEPDVPEDPEEPDLPGIPGGGGGGSGTPLGTGVSLQIVSADVGVTAGEAVMSIGGSALLTATYPDNPVAVKSATQGTVYLLNVTGITPALAQVMSVTSNGTAVAASGGKWPIIAGTGSTSVVVTLGFPPLKTLLVDVVSLPSISAPATDNAVTVSPAAHLGTDRWVAGTVLTLTPVPVAGYSHVLWQRADAAGATDEEPGGVAYAFSLDTDTVVTAGFRKASLDVVLTVKGSDALAAKFDWTYEESDADDTVPAEMTHALFTGSQLGIFKITADKLQTAGDAAYNTYVDMPIKAVEVSYDGGVTWEDAGGDYPDTYNAQTSPRAAARVGKHTIPDDRIPLNDTLHVRVRLVATVSVSVGMPPVRWGGPAWQAAGSMIGTGQNNWGCGFGTGSISGIGAWDGLEKTAAMSYNINTLANPEAVVPLATLMAQEASPYIDYFNEYPYIDMELGDIVTAVCTPATGFYFAAWIDGYFSHTWEDTGEALTSEDRLIWPVGNYISTEPTAQIVVNEGIKKIMLKMKATVAPRYVLFTQDSGEVSAVRPGASVPEEIVPTVSWAYYQDLNAANTQFAKMRFIPYTPTASAARTGTFAQLLTAWDATEGEMTALGITFANSTIWQVNRSNLVTTAERIAFNAVLSWGPYASVRFDTDPAYLGVYRRVHLTNKAGTHEVGEWEFVGRGDFVPASYDPAEYAATAIKGMAQKFTVDIEYRVRWVPYVEPTTPDEEYQITVGYHEEEDMAQGVVSATIGGVSTGEINSRVLTPKVQPADEVVLHATPRAGFDFVSWVNAAEEVVSTEADHTVDPDVDGYVFLANFTASIVVLPDNTTAFHVGYVAGNAGRGSIAVRIWRADTTVENYTVTAAGGADYQLASGDTAYVAAVAATGWTFGGWVDSYGLPRAALAGYDPLVDVGTAGVALYGDVYFAEVVVPPVTGNVAFRVGFLNPADVPHALVMVSVNGTLVATLNGVQHVDMMLTEGDYVSMDAVVSTGRLVTGYVDLTYVPVTLPVTVQNVSVTDQGALIVLGLEAPPVVPPPDVVPGTPVTGAGLWLFDGGTENKGFVWRSRRFETPVPTEFNSVRVSRNGSYFPQAVAIRLNAYSSPETTSASTDINLAVDSDVPRRLPKIRRERYFEIEVTAKDDVECVKLASSMGELQNG